MNAVYVEYEKSLFVSISNALNGLIPIVDLQKLICAYVKANIVDVIIDIISGLRPMKFDVANLKFKVSITCESYKTFVPPYKNEMRVLFTVKEMELLNGKKSLFGYSTIAWSIDYARHNFSAECIAQDIERLTRFGIRMSTMSIHEIEKIMPEKTLDVANEIVAMSISNAKKLGSAELLGRVCMH